MEFSSLVFICIFLPVTFGLYSAVPSTTAKNYVLIVASLLFYAYGEPVYVLLMIGSTIMNWLFGKLVAPGRPRGRKPALIAAIVINLVLLGFFKYAGMAVSTLNAVTGLSIPVPAIALPVGISFFTFQAMSYVIDVYRGDAEEARSYLDVLLYVSLFPQLIAGPIVRYKDISQQIAQREQSITEVAPGLRRFLFGLAKKVLLANQFGAVADALYGANPSELFFASAWLAAISYMLQIYFDFSAYSDMAIGLGHLFGFTFRENFDYPYVATSIQDFWRRWHISLSTWFREYVYIPLGGNRKGRARAAFNRFVVFFLCGLWHGASWTFVAWGVYHGLFLLLEEFVPALKRLPKALGHVYALVVVLFGWVLFRSESFGQALFMASCMLVPSAGTHVQMQLLLQQLTPLFLVTLVIGVIASTPVRNFLAHTAERRGLVLPATVVSYCCGLVLLCLSLLELSAGGYNPFIYFRF